MEKSHWLFIGVMPTSWLSFKTMSSLQCSIGTYDNALYDRNVDLVTSLGEKSEDQQRDDNSWMSGQNITTIQPIVFYMTPNVNSYVGSGGKVIKGH